MKSPLESNLITGLQFNLTCRFYFPDIVDVTPIPSVRWRRDGVILATTLEGAIEEVSPGIYEQILSFSSLELEEQGNYSCDSNISVSINGSQLLLSGNVYYAVAIERELGLV